MLTLTPVATQAIRQLTSQADDPDASGIRISHGPDTPQGTALELSLVQEPEPEDETVDEDGARIYLEPDIATFLDDKVLDAQVEEGQVTFLLRDGEQPPPSYGHPNGHAS